MHLSSFIRIIFAITVLSIVISCSATRYVPKDEYLLKKYEITVSPKEHITPATLSSYIIQRPNTTPFFGWKVLWARLLKGTVETPAIFDPEALERSKDNIDRYATSQGYYFNTIVDSVVHKNRKATVHLHLQLGRQYHISTIQYVIPDSVMRSFVFPDTVNSLLRYQPILSEALVDRESERIATHLRKFGYYNFSKNHILFVADTLQGYKEAALTVHFKEGSREDEIALSAAIQQRFKIESIQVFPDWQPEKSIQNPDYESKMDSIEYKGIKIYYHGKLNLRPKVISRVNQLEMGEYYNEQLVNTTYNRFSSLRFYSGVTLQFDALNTKSSSLPTNANNGDDTQAPDGALNCRIRLTPSKIQGYKINLEASSNSSGLVGISPALSYFHKNIFKGGEWLTASFSGNFQFKFNNPIRSTELGVSTTLTFPTLLFPHPQSWFKNYTPQTDINTSYSFQQRPEFIRNILSLHFAYTWRGGERLYYRFAPAQLNIVRLYNVDSTFYQSLNDPFLINSYMDHFDLGSSFTLYYTTDNTPLPKSSYYYFRWTTDVSGNSLGLFSRNMQKDHKGSNLLWGTAYSQYCRNEINTVYTWKPVPEHGIALRFYGGVGVAYGNSDAMPFEKLFYAGGANSLRAWQARAVGPGSMPLDTTFSIPNQTGDVKLEANMEYRPKLFWKLEGALFIDAGNIWTLRQDAGREAGAFRLKDFHKSIAMAVGAGIRLNLEFVLLRLDMGFVLRDPYQQKWIAPSQWLKPNMYAIQFGVGYPFL